MHSDNANPTASSPDANTLSPSVQMAFIAAISAIAGGLYGYDTGIISGALLQITREFGLNSTTQELVASAILAGAVVGALTCTYSSSHFGRRRTIMIVAGIYAFGVLAAALSPGPWWLMGSRLVLGFAVGGSTQIVPTYIAELAPSDKRGRLVTYFNVSIGVGILCAAIVGYALQDIWNWRVMIGVAVVPSLMLLFGMMRLPSSPRWLVEQGRLIEARHALSRVRETKQEVHEEMADIRELNEQLEDERSG